jgi:hypothetical protein
MASKETMKPGEDYTNCLLPSLAKLLPRVLRASVVKILQQSRWGYC